jgi:TRAP transporter TAXI family solute receptor
MAFPDIVRNNWPAVTVAVMAAAIGFVSIAVVATMPPRVIVMATGPAGGAYSEMGRRYQVLLARSGIEVRLQQTEGALENLALLQNPRSGVSVGLLQGGTVGVDGSSELESLGTVFYEPLWLFYRGGVSNPTSDDLKGRKISVGPMGSGTRVLAIELLKRMEIDDKISQFLPLTPQQAADKLLAGEIDVAMITNAWESSAVQRLVADPRIELVSFQRADALVALLPYLEKVVVPRGVGDLAQDRPPQDVTLLAPKASLVVRQDLHPAIQYLLLKAAVQIHGGSGIFQHANQFPAGEAVEIPLSSEAQQFYKSGPPFLTNYLPFWMAGQVSKLMVLLIPIIGVLYPLLRSLPFAYDWMMRSKISRIYGELRFLEDQMNDARRSGRGTAEMIDELDRIDELVNGLSIPVAYASMLYMLRNHIDIVRERLRHTPRTG